MTPAKKSLIGASTGAVLLWVAALLITQELGYRVHALEFLTQDAKVFGAAAAGLVGTLVFIIVRSSVELPVRLFIVAASLSTFMVLSIFGGLWVACANGDCL
jgi:Co/Zn/Cd efflux system component